MLLYLNLLEKTRDLSTLERAYSYLRTDKRVSASSVVDLYYRCNSELVAYNFLVSEQLGQSSPTRNYLYGFHSTNQLDPPLQTIIVGSL